MQMIKKYMMLSIYVFVFPLLLFFILIFQIKIPTIVNVIFISFQLLFTYYLFRKIKKHEEDKDSDYEGRLLLKENELQALFDNNNSYLWSIDLEKKIFFSSAGFEKIFGYPREAFKNNYELWLERVIPEDMHLAKAHYDKVKAGQHSNQSWRFRDSNEEIKWLDAWGAPILTNGEVTRVTGVAYDITDRKRLEEELKHSAIHDRLTGLPNRTILDNYIDDELKKNRSTPLSFSVLFIDLDRFKFVNDNYGHATGDQVLIEAARRIKKAVGERGIVTRHGGDEFVIVVPYKDHEKLVAVATKILRMFETPFQLNGEQIISASIGISLYPNDGETLPTLISQADQAMYQAKSKGKKTYQFANPIHSKAELRKDKIKNDLQTVLKTNQLEVWYQPKVVLKTNDIYGAEALLRWNHPEFGAISPNEFIPIAEAEGMIHEIGLWVLDEVMKKNKDWEVKGLNLTCAVNVSNLQFESPEFLDGIQQMLIQNEVNPEKLTIEITETSMHNATSNKSIEKLKEIGFDISIDGFGTGYCALSTLNAQLFDEIKIDKSFTRSLTGENAKPQIVQAILSLSDAFSFRTVAEGIETKEEADILQEMGCLYGQGYLYGPPVKPEIIEEQCSRNHH